MNEILLCQTLNYHFKNIELLKQALTRQSAISEKIPGAGEKTYQRLEFLGDSILYMILSEMIYKIFPDSSECEMTNLRCMFVNNDFLGKIAKSVGLGKYMKIGKGEEKQNIRENIRMLADVFEAVIGAIYTDSNDFEITKKIVLNIYKKMILEEKRMQNNLNNLSLYYSSLNTNKPSTLLELKVAPGPKLEITKTYYDFTSNLKKLLLESNEDSFKRFISNACNNILIDYEIYNTINNLNDIIASDNIKNYIYFVSKITKDYYYSFNLKSHYICCKILLSLLMLYRHSNPFIFFTTLFCLTHNGISEYFRNNYENSNEYFESALKLMKEKQIRHPEIKLLLYYFYNRLHNYENIEYFLGMIEIDNSIKTYLNYEVNYFSIHVNSLLTYMKYISQIRNESQKENNIEKVLVLYNEIQIELDLLCQKNKQMIQQYVYYSTCFDLFELKKNLNILDANEMKNLESKLKKDSAQNLFLDIFYRFYLKHGIEFESNNKYSEIMRLLLGNYTVTSSIITEELKSFPFLINIEINNKKF